MRLPAIANSRLPPARSSVSETFPLAALGTTGAVGLGAGAEGPAAEAPTGAASRQPEASASAAPRTRVRPPVRASVIPVFLSVGPNDRRLRRDNRKSTRLNSSH